MIMRIAFTRFWVVLYGKLLRGLRLGERRCSYCKKLMWWKRMGPTALLIKPFVTSHGICKSCNAIHFPEPAPVIGVDYGRSKRMDPVTGFITDNPPRRQRQSRKNMRRRLGGWSGAVAR